jgi:Na+/H+ antiporter NhaD/arsenite permease-like protein
MYYPRFFIRIRGTDDIKPYNVLILFFSLSYIAITLDVTGIFTAAAYWVGNVSGRSGVKLRFISFYFLITVLSCFFGNYPMIFSGTLFLVYYTDVTDVGI